LVNLLLILNQEQNIPEFWSAKLRKMNGILIARRKYRVDHKNTKTTLKGGPHAVIKITIETIQTLPYWT
jgi:hypothetical protein